MAYNKAHLCVSMPNNCCTRETFGKAKGFVFSPVAVGDFFALFYWAAISVGIYTCVAFLCIFATTESHPKAAFKTVWKTLNGNATDAVHTSVFVS